MIIIKKMKKDIDLYDLIDKTSNEQFIEDYTLKFNHQQDLYNSFHEKLFNILSSIEDETCKEIIEQMDQFNETFAYINDITNDYKNIIDIMSILATKLIKKKEKISNLKIENESMHHEIEELSSQASKMENDYNILSNDYLKLLQQATAFKNRKESDSSLSHLIGDLGYNTIHEEKKKVQELKQNDLMSQIEELKKENENLTKELQSQSFNLESITKEKTELNLKISQMQTEINQKYILKSLSDFQILKLRKENDALIQRMKSLQTKNDNLVLEIDNLNQEIKNLNSINSKKEVNYQLNVIPTAMSTQGNVCNPINTIIDDDNASYNYLSTLDLGKELGDEEDNNVSPQHKIQITPTKIIEKMNDNKFNHLLCENCKKSTVKKGKRNSIKNAEKEDYNEYGLLDRLYLFDFI